jgi:hypothetical protein
MLGGGFGVGEGVKEMNDVIAGPRVVLKEVDGEWVIAQAGFWSGAIDDD